MDQDLADRLLPLEGGINFRDMGGYRTADGRRLKWRHLYRSGTMARLTTADYAHLEELGIRYVIDLRTMTEQTAEPNRWCADCGVAYWSRDHDEVFGNLHEMVDKGIATQDEARAVMVNGFRYLPFQQAEAYAHLFQSLAAGRVPLAFNCTAGKDRTGGAAALVLAALGVPRETIAADFTMTERAVDLQKAFRSRADDANSRRFRNADMQIMAPLGAAHPSYIEAFLDAVEQECGSVENYLADQGIARSDLDAIRAELLE